MNKLHQSDRLAIQRVVQVDPQWHCDSRAGDVLGISKEVILHAGPKFNSLDEITAPIMNSACAAIVFEGLASDFEQARKLILDGTVRLLPAQDFRVVVPLAGVVTTSMWVHNIVDSNNCKNTVYSPFNGGNGPAMRLGLYSGQVVHHLQWINSELADFFNSCKSGQIELIPIAMCALKAEDDCHGRTIEATRELKKRLLPAMNRYPRVLEFFDNGPSFFLNLWMAACKCMLAGGDCIENSSLITAAGGNGRQVGIRISGVQNRWFTAEATPPAGDVGVHPVEKILGAIGDSAIVDAAGFGAMGVSFSEPQRQLFSPYLPQDYSILPKILLHRTHERFGDMGFLTGLCARTVAETKTTPIVSLGILDKDGKAGRVGGGIYRYPLDCFTQAVGQLH